MYNKLSDFLTEWEYESESTLKIFEQLTDDSLSKKFNDNVRTPGRLAWHIVNTIGEMVQRTGSVDTILVHGDTLLNGRLAP